VNSVCLKTAKIQITSALKRACEKHVISDAWTFDVCVFVWTFDAWFHAAGWTSDALRSAFWEVKIFGVFRHCREVEVVLALVAQRHHRAYNQ